MPHETHKPRSVPILRVSPLAKPLLTRKAERGLETALENLELLQASEMLAHNFPESQKYSILTSQIRSVVAQLALVRATTHAN